MRRALVIAALAACSPPAIQPLPPNAFAFGVFGDGPYTPLEENRFGRLLRDVNGGNLQWLIHIGDIQGHPCTNEILADRHRSLQSIEAAVIYTPGDNEWTDCYRNSGGGFDPLERLQNIRRTLFATPGSTLGRRPIAVETQSDDSAWTEFVENVRWRYGGFLFITAHLVGSGNGTGIGGESPPPERLAEADRRMAAALQWIDTSFAIARNDSLHGLVIAMHADPGFERPEGAWPAYREFVQHLATRAGEFSGLVLFIHGDSHVYRVDRPLMRSGGDTISNFTRLETYGSQDIGWVRVVVDSVAGRVISYEPRLMRQRLLW